MSLTTEPERRKLPRNALYYPFHLCHERTLQLLLERYDTVHFRDYMALQLTPLSGTTACSDRMGDRHEVLLREGRIVQGYRISGPLNEEAVKWVDRDLADPAWRARFHEALRDDRRFQHGLFDLSHGLRTGNRMVPGPAALLRLIEPGRVTQSYAVREIQSLSTRSLSPEDGYVYDYGVALVKTSAALCYTIRLCLQHGLGAVTDSAPHFHLLAHGCKRESLALPNEWLPRSGY